MAVNINDITIKEIKKWVQEHPELVDVQEVFHLDNVNDINEKDIEFWMINTLDYYLKEEMGYDFGLD